MKQAKQLILVISAILLSIIMGCSKGNTDAPMGSVGDAVITAKVKAALVKEPSLKASDIKVDTTNGAVQLSGTASSQADVNHAAEVAKQVDGVKAVKNDVQVKAA